VYAPAIEEVYFMDSKSAYKAYLNINNFRLKDIRRLPIVKEKENFVIVASKSHLNDETKSFINSLKTEKTKKFISKGSSLKLCMIAEGIADIYPRLAPTMEWDTAAADAIVRKAGGMTYEYETQKPLVYNKKNLLNPYFIVRKANK
jgi:3'(2'), 5'-bisphosphate nucleotidase